MGRMGIYMGYRRRFVSGAGSRHGSWLASRPRGGMRGESGLPASHHTCLALHPRTKGSHCVAWMTVEEADLLKQREYTLRTASYFQGEGVVSEQVMRNSRRVV
jgi:hypothetical protein